MAEAPNSHPFVGRERELTALRRALVASERDRGATWLISGEPGAGKTSLAHELLNEARIRG